ncbi:hypothetical protein CVT25_015697 [Psilocybe cyanescens]|uniref:Uncharacterized protein n=1 Tax=Psilocybe cyanescens TaxID=93625 RepID=A0A409XJN6_PSICY|nr:hypothetical protein CVT25_015697 [Psilocybe cyanescens]
MRASSSSTLNKRTRAAMEGMDYDLDLDGCGPPTSDIVQGGDGQGRRDRGWSSISPISTHTHTHTRTRRVQGGSTA